MPYLAVSAPLVIRVLISSSWPYLAATWRGVLPYLSTQSISPPDEQRQRQREQTRGRRWNRSKRREETSTLVPVGVTVLDENLRACEASVNGCHVQGALPFFALENSREQGKKKKKRWSYRHVFQLV